MATRADTVGDLLRDWRARRRLSQLDLAGEAEVSTRHLSFVESGRSAPSRELLLRLAEPLALPLRERNRLLLAAGFAPVYGERVIDAPDMAAARDVVEAVLNGHSPFPALAVDRHWNLVLANDAARALLASVDATLLTPPVNVLRVSLHPDGLAPMIVNIAEWRHHLLSRLRDEADGSADPVLARLHDELRAIPIPAGLRPPSFPSPVAVPLTLRDTATGRLLSFISTTTVFGTATDVTLAELTLESFYPADDDTRRAILGDA
ncbi:MAG: helix-turn-helix transcriptional regulator [Sphingomonas sp.]|uniref:helix-turn-helix domain-containing protein n=1 Tax=Sphingomonas sp. TaxID=28214 RepID=UPI001AC66D28|nr:helix-turn-helix transcriptional regulator [Sphingomonas sp.]MBN8809405.1 helix-turn-helix transcriptional regulator [Sphingomonas sp.]